MKNIIISTCGIIAILFCMSNCSTTKEEPPDTVINIPLEVPGTLLPEEGKARLRTDEYVKRYYIGRYIDPNDKTVMYEANTIYRVEQPSSWITTPRPVKGIPEGVALKVGTDRRTQALIAEFEHDIQIIAQTIHKLNEQSNNLELSKRELNTAIKQLNELKKQIEDEKRISSNYDKRFGELEQKIAQLEFKLLFETKKIEEKNQPNIQKPQDQLKQLFQ